MQETTQIRVTHAEAMESKRRVEARREARREAQRQEQARRYMEIHESAGELAEGCFGR